MINKPFSIPAIVLDSELKSQEGVIRPLGKNGVPIIALSSKADCPAFHSKFVRKIEISPSVIDNEHKFIDFLINLPVKGVLIYSDDVSAVAISKYQKVLKDSGFLINIPDHVKLTTLFDKWECYKIAKSLNIAMAKSELIRSMDEIETFWDDFEKPIILKGTRLAGGNYYKIEKKDDISDAWGNINRQIESVEYKARKSDIMLQEYHNFKMHDNWSCETIYTKDSMPVGFFTIKRLRCSLNADGTFSSLLLSGHYQHNQELIYTTEKMLSAMNWKGFAHVEYFYVPKKNEYLLTEVNPRLPGYSSYPGKAGFNMAYYYYLDLIDKEISTHSNFKNSVFFTTFTYPGDLSESIKYLLKGHIKFFPFIRSYFLLFKRGWIKVIDPVYFDDMAFTAWKQIDNLNRFFNRSLAFIKKKLFHPVDAAHKIFRS